LAPPLASAFFSRMERFHDLSRVAIRLNKCINYSQQAFPALKSFDCFVHLNVSILLRL
jgi:hypothetical protein